MSRRRRLRTLKRRRIILAGVLASLPVMWAVGLWVFAAGLPLPRSTDNIPRVSEPQADAIVVFTGGNDRLDTGFALLRGNYAKDLFISGVHRGVEVAALVREFSRSRSAPCCVIVGYNAQDTYGNAQESLSWTKDKNIRRIILVTSSYHMPRSLYYFEKSGEPLEVLPFPVLSTYGRNNQWGDLPGTRALIISEYNKYLLTVLSTTFSGFDEGVLSPQAFTRLP